MNETKSRQGEGYDFYDLGLFAYNAAGGLETEYVVGTNARAALPGLGVGDNAAWPVSETIPVIPPIFPGLILPHNAQNSMLRATTDILIRFVSRELVMRWLFALQAGAPFSIWPIPTLQVTYPANQWFTVPDKWALLYVVAAPGQPAGVLWVKSSG
jgi:hypothetical protein